MLILKWLQSILVSGRSETQQAAAGQADNEFKKVDRKDRKIDSIDVVNAALVDHAEDLDDLITAGSSWMQRKKLKKQIRRKVEMAMSKEFSESEIIEEVTDRITDVAEIDSYYKNLFCKNS